MDKLLWIAPLIICIIMHIWMMKNHGGHDKTKEGDKK